jgi:hypothetical protein
MPRTNWLAHPRDIVLQTFSRFCGPTALADLMEVTPLEAADLLLSVEGMCHPQATGSVRNVEWNLFLQEDLGLKQVDTSLPLPLREAIVAERRAKGGWEPGEHTRWVERGWSARRQQAPNIYDRNIRYPTVAQWLRANPTATGILNVQGHTLAVRDGQVTGDTLHTKSMRRRVEGAFLMETPA